MSDIGWSLPECVATNDHWWHGGSVCSACGARLRCGCGRFVREDGFAAHEPVCPWLARIDAEIEDEDWRAAHDPVWAYD